MHLKKLYIENTNRKHGIQRKQKMPFPLKTNEKFHPLKHQCRYLNYILQAENKNGIASTF